MTPETAIKNQIKDYLDLKGIFHFPVLQGLGAAKGVPDRIAVKDGIFYGIEVKTPKGRLSEHQKAFRDRVVAAGGVYIEARSVEDVMAHFEPNQVKSLAPGQVVKFGPSWDRDSISGMPHIRVG